MIAEADTIPTTKTVTTMIPTITVILANLIQRTTKRTNNIPQTAITIIRATTKAIEITIRAMEEVEESGGGQINKRDQAEPNTPQRDCFIPQKSESVNKKMFSNKMHRASNGQSYTRSTALFS